LQGFFFQVPCRSFRFEGSHVDAEAVLRIGFEQARVGFIDLLDGDDFDDGGDGVNAAKVEHLLGFSEAADGGAGETAAPVMRSKAETPMSR
jgi:hypothetical protein